MKTTACLLVCNAILYVHATGQMAFDFFDGNNVRAFISSQGNHFYNESTSMFQVPVSGDASTLFTSSIWVGAIDNDSNICVAGEMFRESGYDYSPGPVGNISSYDPPGNGTWNRLWKVNRVDIEHWLSDPANVHIPQVVLDWPAYGNKLIGQSNRLAPFVDVNKDGVYNPADLDHPLMRGDQMLYFIYNDDAAPHFESGGQKLGIEIHGMAYGFDCPNNKSLDHAIFFHHTIVNRSNQDYRDLFVGLFNDFILGNPMDNLIGSDPLRNMYFAYNGDNDDENYEIYKGYGGNIPAQGVRILKGLPMKDDGMDNLAYVSDDTYNGFGMNDGVVDNERIGLQRFISFKNIGYLTPFGNPYSAEGYYNYLRGHWLDGSPLVFSNDGYDPNHPSPVLCRYMYPDSSDTVHMGTNGLNPRSYWIDRYPGRRRGIGSMGPVDLNAGDTIDFDHVYVFAQEDSNRLAAVNKMKRFSDRLQDMFDKGITPCGGFEPEFSLAIDNTMSQAYKVYPNPTTGAVNVQGTDASESYEIVDMQGRMMAFGEATSGSTFIDVGPLAPGIYMLKIKGKSNEFILRVVKQH